MNDTIVVLAKDDSYIHVGTREEMLGHRRWSTRKFDAFDATGKPVALSRDHHRPGRPGHVTWNPTRVLARVHHCLNGLADEIDARPDLTEDAWMASALRGVEGDLPEVLRRLCVDDLTSLEDGQVVATHSKGYFHNLVHKLRGD